jgi:hypothetical protein
MPKVNVTAQFSTIEQISQKVGPGDDHMVGTIAVRITHQGKPFDTHVTVKQVTGTSYTEGGNIEISLPVGYRGPLDYMKFAEAGERHFRNAVGPEGFLNIKGSDIVMEGNVFDLEPTTVTMEVDDVSGAAW